MRGKCTLTTNNSNDSEEDDDSKSKEGNEGICLDVGVSVLIHLHQNYTTSDEHKGSIYVSEKLIVMDEFSLMIMQITKLEIGIAWTNMIKGTHETFQDKTKTHGIVDTKELWHSTKLLPIVRICQQYRESTCISAS